MKKIPQVRLCHNIHALNFSIMRFFNVLIPCSLIECYSLLAAYVEIDFCKTRLNVSFYVKMACKPRDIVVNGLTIVTLQYIYISQSFSFHGIQ